MSPRVAVVTDSTAYLPPGVAATYDVVVVPLQVVLGGRVGAEGRDISPQDVAAALAQRSPVSTSRPSPQAFAAAFAEAAEITDAQSVVVVTLSGNLSGTVEAAEVAACESALDVHVVDSRSTAMGLGFAVIAAAEAAADGGDVEQVVKAARHTAERTSTLFYVDTLEHLRRGGRIGAAQALLGSALAIKPILHVVDGRIAPLEKVRTTSRALARLEDLAVAAAGEGGADLAVHHLAAAERAQALAARLRDRIPNIGVLYTSEVGAVIGAHVGPGLLGVIVSPH